MLSWAYGLTFTYPCRGVLVLGIASDCNVSVGNRHMSSPKRSPPIYRVRGPIAHISSTRFTFCILRHGIVTKDSLCRQIVGRLRSSTISCYSIKYFQCFMQKKIGITHKRCRGTPPLAAILDSTRGTCPPRPLLIGSRNARRLYNLFCPMSKARITCALSVISLFRDIRRNFDNDCIYLFFGGGNIPCPM